MLNLAIRNLKINKARTSLAVLGLVLGVITIIALVSISTGVQATLTETISQMKGIFVLQKDSNMPFLSKLTPSQMDSIESIAGVRVVAPRLVELISNIDGKVLTMTTGTATLMGIDPNREAQTVKGPTPIPADLVKGRFLSSSDKYAVLLGKSLADDLDKSVGSKIEVDNKTFTVAGIYSTGITQSERQIVTTIDAVRETYGFPADRLSGFYVDIHDPSQDAKIATMIELKDDDLDARTSAQFSAELGSLLSNINIFLWVISIIATLVGGIGVLNTMLMSVFERMREFGVLRATGWTTEDIMRLVVTEALIIGLLGGVTGIILGIILVQIVKGYIGIPMRVDTLLMIYAMAFSMFVGIIGGTYPAWKASKMDPVEAMRQK